LLGRGRGGRLRGRLGYRLGRCSLGLGLCRRLLRSVRRGRRLLAARALGGLLGTRPAAATAARPAWAAALALAPLAHRTEALAVGTAPAAALARGAKALGGAAAAARLVLVAETRVALRDALVALGHDLALV